MDVVSEPGINQRHPTGLWQESPMRTVFILTIVFIPASWPVQAADTRKFHLVVVSGDYDSLNGASMHPWSELINKRSDGRLIMTVFYQSDSYYWPRCRSC